MQTTKLISSISYNTPAFLRGKLYDLVRQGIIEYAHWIWHNPEEDEKKEHAHLVLKPNRRLDTSKLRNEFVEPVTGEEKPRGVLPFTPSKMNDWILYGVHDRVYLLRKCQNRKHHYEQKDIETTEPDLLNEHWRECHEGEDSRLTQVIELAGQGMTWPELLKTGLIPVNQLFQYREVFMTFVSPVTERADRKGHEDETAEN